MEKILELTDIEAWYGGIQALKGISLHVDKGEIVTLIGSNGAGKSTTLKSISGQVPIKKGSILFNGKDIANIAAHKTAVLGISQVPEGRRIFPKLSVRENLLIGAFAVKDKQLTEARMQKVFEYFPRLKERVEQKGGTMSGGEQQMLAIGRALMMQPEVLMLDEPSIALRPLLSSKFLKLLKSSITKE